MALVPRWNWDMTGWQEIDCADADRLYTHIARRGGCASGFTEMDAAPGELKLYREWWADGHPLLRDYRRAYPGRCRHYAAIDDSAAIDDEEE